jgi:8-amino-7-oxononanoate synthase
MWDDFRQSLQRLREQDRLRRLTPRRIEGVELVEADGRRLINFGSNDYLGLASTFPVGPASSPPRAATGSGEPVAPRVGPIGATASGLVCGWTDHHERLARRLAEFEGTERTVLFPSGYAACSGTLATLAGPQDLILSDQLNHASLIDGCRLSKAQRVIYPHRDVAAVEEQLRQRRSAHRRVWIVTDAVFSMDGHVAPLEGLCRLARQHEATVVVDEAHGTGVLGEQLSGACEALGVKDQVPIRIGTLSKALGSQGGFVACPGVIADVLINRCRSLIFSTALALPAVRAAAAALQGLANLGDRRRRVASHARRLRAAVGLPAEGIEAMVPIVPIEVGRDAAAVAASQRLERLGLFVPAIRPPTVPEGRARLRVSLSAAHSDAMLGRLIDALSQL